MAARNGEYLGQAPKIISGYGKSEFYRRRVETGTWQMSGQPRESFGGPGRCNFYVVLVS